MWAVSCELEQVSEAQWHSGQELQMQVGSQTVDKSNKKIVVDDCKGDVAHEEEHGQHEVQSVALYHQRGVGRLQVTAGVTSQGSRVKRAGVEAYLAGREKVHVFSNTPATIENALPLISLVVCGALGLLLLLLSISQLRLP